MEANEGKLSNVQPSLVVYFLSFPQIIGLPTTCFTPRIPLIYMQITFDPPAEGDSAFPTVQFGVRTYKAPTLMITS